VAHCTKVVQNSFEPTEIVGYVSVGEQHTGGIFGKKPNVISGQSFDIGNFYLPDMVRGIGLNNPEQAKVAILEKVNLDTPLDEKHPIHYDTEMTTISEWPYQKTRSGALQGKLMPWDYETRQKWLASIGGVSGLVALTAKIIR